jgi:hypothetical protein
MRQNQDSLRPTEPESYQPIPFRRRSKTVQRILQPKASGGPCESISERSLQQASPSISPNGQCDLPWHPLIKRISEVLDSFEYAAEELNDG